MAVLLRAAFLMYCLVADTSTCFSEESHEALDYVALSSPLLMKGLMDFVHCLRKLKVLQYTNKCQFKCSFEAMMYAWNFEELHLYTEHGNLALVLDGMN